MRFRRYAVTVMDNWTPLRFFWTLAGAAKWCFQFGDDVHLYKWTGDRWQEILIPGVRF